MGIIGVSNSYSSINNNLRNRSREFAMLKSMGMTRDGLKKMLKTEGIYYSICPFIYLYSSMLQLFLLGIVKTNRLFGIKDFLMYLDYKNYVFIDYNNSNEYLLCILFWNSKRIEKDNIVDILSDESVSIII